ncbi:hypothetical protein D0817_16320 [Flavobacterium cupreum]|uniref:Uncharacterized protein n=1 Tax=Flavobacterium cupreum TaxID=2133766 RepID=A0A434A4Y9_9FLAO|nr:hypothetical protein [Flavobacterium cupreum]RUT69402.1 hypothetical protein D0817_16320 [Flavobacterium cupreum]
MKAIEEIEEKIKELEELYHDQITLARSYSASNPSFKDWLSKEIGELKGKLRKLTIENIIGEV